MRKKEVFLDEAQKILRCPDPSCTGTLVLKESTYGKFYGCTNFPHCRNKHAAHQKNDLPLGIPGDAETRVLRRECHEIANQIWKYSDHYERNKMYDWLGRNTNQGHIGMMNKQELLTLKEKLLSYQAGDLWTNP